MSTDDNPFRRVDWTGDQPQPSDDDDEHGLPVQSPRPPGLSDADLKLLTLAAKAIGARAEAVEGEQWVNLHFADGTIAYGWNSLRHSDDMLNLSALLRIDIEWEGDNVVFADGNWSEPTADDPGAAARRAVTRAAAYIAEQRSS